MPVTPEALSLQADLDTQLQAVTDAQVRTLVAAWAVAWAEVAGDLQDTLVDLMGDGARVTRATLLRSLRLRTVLGQISNRLHKLAEDAAVTITSDLDAVIDSAARAQDQIVAAMLPNTDAGRALVRTDWPASELDALDAIVKRSTEQITSLTQPLAPDAEAAVRRELIRGIAVGSNPRETARRIVKRAETGFNGGLTRAMTIARTEMLDAHRAAAAYGQDRHTDVLTGWVWLCHLGPRTCPACLVRHGTEHPLSEAGPHGHQCCRCSRVPKSQSWADLGFDGLDEPDDAVADAKAWFDALPEADQRAIMGPERLRLLKAGKISWEDLATLRRTPGWRESWAVTPVRVLAQASRGRRAS